MAGLAAVLIVAVAFAGLGINNLVHRLTSTPLTNPTSPSATPPDSSTPDWFSALPFNCLGSAGLATGPAPALAYVDAVRTARQPGYDRVAIQFAGGAPANAEVLTQHGATFKQGASGQTVTLNGKEGVMVTLHNADGHTHYDGPTNIKTGDGVVLELYKVQDFEGTVQWAIGLSQMPCFRIGFLDNPTRLVIDFRASSATPSRESA
jgi:hypothetical protein